MLREVRHQHQHETQAPYRRLKVLQHGHIRAQAGQDLTFDDQQRARLFQAGHYQERH